MAQRYNIESKICFRTIIWYILIVQSRITSIQGFRQQLQIPLLWRRHDYKSCDSRIHLRRSRNKINDVFVQGSKRRGVLILGYIGTKILPSRCGITLLYDSLAQSSDSDSLAQSSDSDNSAPSSIKTNIKVQQSTSDLISLTPSQIKDSEATRKASSHDWTTPTLGIAIPALIGMIADPLLSLMDTLYVSQLGSLELAALGACTSIFHLAFNVFRATTAATTSLVATELQENVPESYEIQSPNGGEISSTSSTDGIVTTPKPTESARYVLSTTFQFSTIMGIVVATLLVVSSNFSLACMGIPASSKLHTHAISYLRIRALAAPAVLFITVGEGAFRGYGDTRIPLLASMAAAVTNAVLDPIMMFSMRMGVGGAAAATAISQLVAMSVYAIYLGKRGMCAPLISLSGLNKRKDNNKLSKISSGTNQKSGKPKVKKNRRQVIMTIVEANVSMLVKQFSLLFCWAYATSRATKIGHIHVAAHQVALSLWLVFALLQDGAAVAAQVLMGRVAGQLDKVRSMTAYMLKLAVLQSAFCSMAIFSLEKFAPTIFSKDIDVIRQLHTLMPILTMFQPLVSLTLIMESLAIGGRYFGLLARGTLVATVISMIIITKMTTVAGIWKYGLTSLFLGRCITATIGVVHLNEIKLPHFLQSRRLTGLIKAKAK